MNPVLYFHTLRYLRPVQLYGRIWHALVKPMPSAAPAPSGLAEGRGWIVSPGSPSRMTGPMTFQLLNEERTIAGPDAWDDPGCSRLWRYNLHYFDHLSSGIPAEDQRWRSEAMHRWIAENPPVKGTGWEPYPLSRRIVNWIKWHLSGNALRQETVHSLAVQVRSLLYQVEHEYPGNHLLANAKALLFAGAVFSGGESDAWFDEGARILRKELAAQILPDGGHFERSPMYHAIVLEDLLDVLNLFSALHDRCRERCPDLDGTIRQTVGTMRRWLTCMCHPDGDIALFNDAAFDVACHPAELESYALRLGLPPVPACAERMVVLGDSGYVRVQSGPCVVLMDVGDVGPDFLPGHGHADTLSVEVSIHGSRVIVDPGVYTYETGCVRGQDRGTGMHNTLTINDQDSSEVWSSFRVARRARPVGLFTAVSDAEVEVSCAHDGYRRLRGRPMHKRTLTVTADGFRIEDLIDGEFRNAHTGFLLHPEVRPGVPVEAGRTASGLLHGEWILPNGSTVRWTMEGQTGHYEAASYHPEFGIAADTTRLCGDLTDRRALFSLSWK